MGEKRAAVETTPWFGWGNRGKTKGNAGSAVNMADGQSVCLHPSVIGRPVDIEWVDLLRSRILLSPSSLTLTESTGRPFQKNRTRNQLCTTEPARPQKSSWGIAGVRFRWIFSRKDEVFSL